MFIEKLGSVIIILEIVSVMDTVKCFSTFNHNTTLTKSEHRRHSLLYNNLTITEVALNVGRER